MPPVASAQLPATSPSNLPPPSTAIASTAQCCPYCNIRSHTKENYRTIYPHKAPEWWKPRSDTNDPDPKHHSQNNDTRRHGRSRESIHNRDNTHGCNRSRPSNRTSNRKRYHFSSSEFSHCTSSTSSSSHSRYRSKHHRSHKTHSKKPKVEPTEDPVPPAPADQTLVMIPENVPCIPGIVPPFEHCWMMCI